MQIELYLTLAAVVTSWLEVVKTTWLKPLQSRYSWDAETYRIVVLLCAVASGVVVAFVSGDSVNILNDWHIGLQLPSEARHIVGLLLTGVFISLGNQFIHLVYDMANSLETVLRPENKPTLTMKQVDEAIFGAPAEDVNLNDATH